VPLIDTVSIWVIDSVPVSASADPENIILGLSSNVTSTVKGTIDSIVWDPDSTLNCRNCMNPIATPQKTTTYNATIYYSKNGVVCSNRTSVTITVYQSCDNSLIYVPNTFTPNGDGKNEVFRLRGQGITKVNYFRVYDRWGKLVYEANNVDDPDSAAWNGGLHNDTSRPENTGVFVYVFEIRCVTGQTVSGKGNVTLIR
jgi:gliding motility-associated-like protein